MPANSGPPANDPAVLAWLHASLLFEANLPACHIRGQIGKRILEAILASACISVTELKRDPIAVIEAAGGESVAVLVHNRPSAYLVPAETYKRLLDRLEDLELAELVRARSGERRVKVKLDSL